MLQHIIFICVTHVQRDFWVCLVFKGTWNMWSWSSVCSTWDSLFEFFAFSAKIWAHQNANPPSRQEIHGKQLIKIAPTSPNYVRALTDSLKAPYPTTLACLRVRAFFHKTVRVCHDNCNFKIGFTCRITVIFGTLKDGSLLINTLASNICFSYRNMFQNGVDALSKIVDAFLS